MSDIHTAINSSRRKPAHTIQCKGRLLDVSTPKIMGILNCTPDSFYDGGKYVYKEDALVVVENMIQAGVDMIDVGGMSSRPGASLISVQEEMDRVMPVLEAIVAQFPDVVLSIDTVRSDIAAHAIRAGASIVNDISGGEMDLNMFQTVSDLMCPYIINHMLGKPENMQEHPYYEQIATDVGLYFSKKIDQLTRLGVKDIILDPGFGFGKTLEQNYQLLHHLPFYTSLFELPVLVGVSRKSMIYTLLKTVPEKALHGTIAVHMIALMQGANIIRVHDVKEAKEALTIFDYYLSVHE